jgi:hypothetical protein
VPDVPVAFTPVLHMIHCRRTLVGQRHPEDHRPMDQVARDRSSRCATTHDAGLLQRQRNGGGNAAVLRLTLEQAPTSGQRRRLLDLLRRTYRRDWSALCRDFDPEGATSFEELDHGGRLYLRAGSHGIQTMRQFLGLAAERYYSLVREIICKYDLAALVLGDRYNRSIIRKWPAPRRATDAASRNLNASWSDGSFARYQLDTLHALTRRPVLVSEFYLAARENRSGNENKPGFPVVDTQRERVAGFRQTLDALLYLPHVVGADWFQYYDEPTFGRADGENYNFGLVDIHNQPYESLVEAAAALDPTALKNRRASARPTLRSAAGPHDPLEDSNRTWRSRTGIGSVVT